MKAKFNRDYSFAGELVKKGETIDVSEKHFNQLKANGLIGEKKKPAPPKPEKSEKSEK